MSGTLPIKQILKSVCATQNLLMCTHFAAAQQPHSRDIFITQKILPLDKLINQIYTCLQENQWHILLNDFLNHGDVRHQIGL